MAGAGSSRGKRQNTTDGANRAGKAPRTDSAPRGAAASLDAERDVRRFKRCEEFKEDTRPCNVPDRLMPEIFEVGPNSIVPALADQFKIHKISAHREVIETASACRKHVADWIRAHGDDAFCGPVAANGPASTNRAGARSTSVKDTCKQQLGMDLEGAAGYCERLALPDKDLADEVFMFALSRRLDVRIEVWTRAQPPGTEWQVWNASASSTVKISHHHDDVFGSLQPTDDEGAGEHAGGVGDVRATDEVGAGEHAVGDEDQGEPPGLEKIPAWVNCHTCQKSRPLVGDARKWYGENRGKDPGDQEHFTCGISKTLMFESSCDIPAVWSLAEDWWWEARGSTVLSTWFNLEDMPVFDQTLLFVAVQVYDELAKDGRRATKRVTKKFWSDIANVLDRTINQNPEP
ncbi:hypothetical protein T484DRAFT_1800512 [Baffinella frigidus]|nr:hypothetical protein T484DRAFT_1800512 [Cryptophyta sp. CCMP2293]